MLFNGLTDKGNFPNLSGEFSIEPSDLFFLLMQKKIETTTLAIFGTNSTKVQQFFFWEKHKFGKNDKKVCFIKH